LFHKDFEKVPEAEAENSSSLPEELFRQIILQRYTNVKSGCGQGKKSFAEASRSHFAPGGQNRFPEQCPMKLKARLNTFSRGKT